MALEDLTTFPNYILRINEKKEFGRQSTNVDEGTIPKLSDRFDNKRKEVRDQTKIAEFKFPVNHEGRTFFYQQYSNTITARQSTVNGIAGVSSEAYGVGIEDITVGGIFPPAAERNVITPTNVTTVSLLELLPSQYTPKDWADNLERFIKFYLDLNDPYSQIWTTKGYYLETKINLVGRIASFLGLASDEEKARIGFEGKPHKAGYELVIVDEYAKTIQSIQPKDLQIFADKSTPVTFGWRLNAHVIEDKLDANFKEIPDDILQLAASFRLPAISEIPIVGPLSTTVNKLIAISNSVNQMMNTILSYKNVPNTVAQDLYTLSVSNNDYFNKLNRIKEH